MSGSGKIGLDDVIWIEGQNGTSCNKISRTDWLYPASHRRGIWGHPGLTWLGGELDPREIPTQWTETQAKKEKGPPSQKTLRNLSRKNWTKSFSEIDETTKGRTQNSSSFLWF